MDFDSHKKAANIYLKRLSHPSSLNNCKQSPNRSNSNKRGQRPQQNQQQQQQQQNQQQYHQQQQQQYPTYTSSVDNNNNNTYYYLPQHQTNRRRKMNNLAPRFQQRAVYSQYYQTDYSENSWRANLLAAQSRHYKHNNSGCNSRQSNNSPTSNNQKTINQTGPPPPPTAAAAAISVNYVNLGTRPEPEGAPAASSATVKGKEDQNCITAEDCTKRINSELHFHNILNDNSDLFSNYGSDSELGTGKERNEKEDLNPNLNTASILNYAFQVGAECGKRTVLSYAVIGAELHSLDKLHSCRTATELSKISKRAQRISDNIDEARRGLKELALGLRAVKQNIKSSSCRLRKNSPTVNSSQSDLSTVSEDLDRKQSTKKNSLPSAQSFSNIPNDHRSLAGYCTVSRYHRSKNQNHHSFCEPLSFINSMNLDSATNMKTQGTFH